MKMLILGILSMVSLSAHSGFDMSTDELTEGERYCYAQSMIGFDFVINSRVGLPAEDGLIIAAEHQFFPQEHPMSELSLLIVIYDAYLWKGSPHTYAIKTFASCVIQ